MADWSGRTIGGYQLAEEIGHGGAATVYRAYQPQLERWVALKMLNVQDSGGREFLHRFRREAKAIAALRHPNIVNIYDYGEEQGMAYIVMEYITGGALDRRMIGKPKPIKDALDLAIPIADALTYAHSQKIVHRDVKPANILLDRSDWPLLGDFGLAKVIGSRRKITLPGAIVGTAVYLSPEQVAGQDVGPYTDIYSLAVVLYELLTGQLPFQAETPAESMIMRMYQPPISPSQLNAQISPSLEKVLLHAMERELNARYAAMADFQEDLQHELDRITDVRSGQSEFQTTRMITTNLRMDSAHTGPQLFIATSGIAVNVPLIDEVLVGRRDPLMKRAPDVDLDPYGGASAGVSRQHAQLLYKPEGWFIEDLQSTNGTFVNEVRLSPRRPFPLHSGDIVRFGQLSAIFNVVEG